MIPATPPVAGDTGAASISTPPLDAGNSVFKVTVCIYLGSHCSVTVELYCYA